MRTPVLPKVHYQLLGPGCVGVWLLSSHHLPDWPPHPFMAVTSASFQVILSPEEATQLWVMVARMGPTGPCGVPVIVMVLVEDLFPSGTPGSKQVQQPVMVDGV